MYKRRIFAYQKSDKMHFAPLTFWHFQPICQSQNRVGKRPLILEHFLGLWKFPKRPSNLFSVHTHKSRHCSNSILMDSFKLSICSSRFNEASQTVSMKWRVIPQFLSHGYKTLRLRTYLWFTRAWITLVKMILN